MTETNPLHAHNDVIIDDGFPKGWHVQDRMDENIALLCAPTNQFSPIAALSGWTVICQRPKAMTTEAWIDTARAIAKALANSQK